MEKDLKYTIPVTYYNGKSSMYLVDTAIQDGFGRLPISRPRLPGGTSYPK